MRLIAASTIILLLLAWCPSSTTAQDMSDGRKHHIVVFLDNDVFQGTDQQYTNGFKLTWLLPDRDDYEDYTFLPSWLKRAAKKLPYGDGPKFRHNIGFSLGQHMYTPRDISGEELVLDDRPYAGCTYLSLSLHNKSSSQMDAFAFSIGVVGPSSLAEETQTFIHRNIDSPIPKGWGNQLKDEPAVIVSWEHKWRAYLKEATSGFGVDIIPSVTATAGNVRVSGALSGELRFGYHVPHDFGTALNRPVSGVSALIDKEGDSSAYRPVFGAYISLGAAAYAVLRDIFLDGNTWKESHSVDKETFVSEVGWGATVYYKMVKITYSHIYRSPMYKEQDGGQSYGALSLTFSF